MDGYMVWDFCFIRYGGWMGNRLGIDYLTWVPRYV